MPPIGPLRALQNMDQNLSSVLKLVSRTTSLGLYAQYPGRGPIFGWLRQVIRALVINSAEARLTIQVQAVVVAHALQGEDLGFAVVALDDAFLLQTLGDVLRRVAALEFIDDANARSSL